MSDSKIPRSRLEILEDELIEAQEMMTALFIERDIAMELQDINEAEKQYDYIKVLTKRRNVLKKLLEKAQQDHDKIDYCDILATIFIRN